MTLNAWQVAESVATVVSALVAIIGVIFVVKQLINLDHDVKGNTRASIYEMAARIKEVFLERPHLRPYFFDGVKIGADDEHYAEAIAMADYFCLYLEVISTQKSTVAECDRKAWCRYAYDVYMSSSLLQDYLADSAKKRWYSEPFWAVLNGRVA